MASVDLTYAYYSIPINEDHKKYLRFVWRNKLFEYQALPNGLSPGPRLFTKLLKPVYALMGELGHICFPYIDDSFVMTHSKQGCPEAVTGLVELFKNLGFSINEKKIQINPHNRTKLFRFQY